MKEKNKRRFTTWLATLGFAFFCGLLAFGSSLTQEYKRSSAYDIDDTYGFELTLTSVEANTWYFNNLQNLLLDYDEENIDGLVDRYNLQSYLSSWSSISYENNNFVCYVYELQPDYIAYVDESGANRCFITLGDTLYMEIDDEETSFSYSVVINLQSNSELSANEVLIYQDLVNAFELDIQANTIQPRSLLQILADFVDILVSGIVTLGTGVANGIVAMAQALFLTTSEGVITGLSVFGGILAIFAGLALAVGITTRVYTWVTSLGN